MTFLKIHRIFSFSFNMAATSKVAWYVNFVLFLPGKEWTLYENPAFGQQTVELCAYTDTTGCPIWNEWCDEAAKWTLKCYYGTVSSINFHTLTMLFIIIWIVAKIFVLCPFADVQEKLPCQGEKYDKIGNFFITVFHNASSFELSIHTKT
jgi:hypothetical protein